MNRSLRNIFSSLFRILLPFSSLFLSFNLLAQKPLGSIRFTTAKKIGDKISISISIDKGSTLSIDGVVESPIKDPSLFTTYTIKQQIITIKGNVTKLFIDQAELTDIDISNMPSLQFLHCPDNRISTLDVSNNKSLLDLECSRNKLTEIKGLANAKQLKNLTCYSNELSTLDLSNLTSLKYLNCDKNRITSLNMSSLKELEDFSCGDNQINRLDLSMNSKLKFIACYENSLTSLDLSTNSRLERIVCMRNQIEGESMAKFLRTLPFGPVGKREVILVSSIPSAVDNIASKADVLYALTRGWKIFNDNNIPYNGVDFYRIALSVDKNGSAKIEGYSDLEKAPYGITLKVKVSPNNGFTLDKVMAGNDDITKALKFVVKGNTIIKVTFKKIEIPQEKFFSVKLDVGEGGRIELLGAKDLMKIKENTELSLKVIPSEGFILDKVMAGNDDITKTLKFVVKGNTIIKVTFKKKSEEAITLVEDDLIHLYPNPTPDFLYIRNSKANEKVALYSLDGYFMFETLLDAKGEGKLDLTHLKNGHYFVQIQNNVYRIIVFRK